jgi:hypothetical protein
MTRKKFNTEEIFSLSIFDGLNPQMWMEPTDTKGSIVQETKDGLSDGSESCMTLEGW